MKIHSARLRNAKWNLTLPLSEARKNDEVISLGDSQMLRWIDELNGVEDADVIAKEIKRNIRQLRRQPSTLQNRRKIKSLYEDLDEVQYKPDYMCLIIDRKKDYLRACQGFKINGIKYVRLLGTNGGVKNRTIAFTSERLSEEIRRRIDNGRDESKPLIPAKFEAYRALTCSGSTPVSMPNGILVVNDCETEFYEDVIKLNDENGTEPTMEYAENERIQLTESDGYGLMLPSLAERWSKELGLDYVVSGVNTRFSWEKGMVFCFDFLDFADNVAHNRIVKDAWGNEVDISTVELILTTSMLKLWYCYDSLEHYLSNCKKNHYTFGIAKTCPKELESERDLNYQFIQSYNLNDGQIDELIQPTIDDIKDILSNDWRKAILFLSGTHLNETNVDYVDNDFAKAIMADERVYDDPFIKRRIYQMIRKRINDAKIGVIRVHANYSIVSGDPFSLCQSIFGLEVTGLLKKGEIYNRYWADRSVDKVVCFRAPMTCHNNTKSVRIADNELISYWYKYMTTCTIFNSWDSAAHALNGMDKDGDLVLLTDNKVLLENHRQMPTIMCAQRNAQKVVITEDALVKSNIASFGDDIGKTTNRITTMFDVQSQYDPNSKEYEVLDYRIKCSQLLQQNAIDNGSMSLKELKKAVADTKKEVESSPITILTKVESLSDGLDQLDEIYADVLDGEDFDFSSILNNDSFKEAFENCGEAYEELIATIAKSPNDLNACQEAFNKLAGEYILNSDALRDVTSATRDATINMLEQKGVANAAVIVDRQLVLNSEELSKKISAVTDATRDETVALLEQKGIVDAASIVDEQLALNKEKLRIETELGADATILEMLAQYDEKTASELTAQALLSLVIAKMQANNTEIETTDDINRLLSLAKAAGVTAESLTNLSNAAALISQAEAIELQYASAISQPGALLGGGAQYLAGLKDQATSLRDEAQKLLDKEITYDLPFEPTDFQYAGGTKTKSAKEKSDKDKDDEETWFDKQLKKHQHLVNMEQESEAEYLSWLKSAYKKAYKEGIIDLDDYRKYKEEVFEKSRELFEDKLNDTEHKISLLESDDGNEKKIITLYEGLIKKVEARIKKARKNGLTDNDDYIQELQNKLQDYADSIKEIQDDITDAAKDALDELVDYRIDMLKDDIEAEKDALDKKLDNLKEFYDKQKELLQDQYDEEKELEERNEKRKAVADIEAELSMLEKDDSAWAQKRKLELQEELSSAQKDLSDFEKESALDKALDALEEVYNSQEAEIEKEIEALDNILNDPQSLFNQALSDIKNNSKNQLYYQMLMYNRQYGDGKDETVREMWESAYGALDDYKKLFGKAYNGVTLSNATNTKSTNSNNKSGSGSSNSKSDTSATGNTSNKNSGSKTNSNSSGDAKKNTSSNDTTKPSLKKGSTVQIKESATKFSSKSNNVKMASFVPGGKFTVYGTSGNQVLIGKNGVYTGWVKKTDIVGYASGTKHATSGLHELYEGGAETLFVSSDGSKYRILNDNDKVFSAKATNFLYDFANDGGALLIQKIKDALTGSAFGNITTPITSNEVNMGDIIVQGNADTKTVSEIRRAQRESVEFMLKEFTKLK